MITTNDEHPFNETWSNVSNRYKHEIDVQKTNDPSSVTRFLRYMASDPIAFPIVFHATKRDYATMKYTIFDVCVHHDVKFEKFVEWYKISDEMSNACTDINIKYRTAQRHKPPRKYIWLKIKSSFSSHGVIAGIARKKLSNRYAVHVYPIEVFRGHHRCRKGLALSASLSRAFLQCSVYRRIEQRADKLNCKLIKLKAVEI